jgi:uncharacterized protein
MSRATSKAPKVVEHVPHRVRAVEHTTIPMPDGTRLAARMWIPEEALERPVPAILEYIPYRKRDVTRPRDAMNHPYLAGHGYACVRVDLRGSGESEGLLQDQYLEQEQADGVEVIRWIAAQPWCDGGVGMFGISWGGFNGLQIAARAPAELKAVIAACATDDLYRDNMHYMGGCLLSDNLSEATTMFAFNACPPDPELVGAAWRSMWRARLEGSEPWLDIWLRHQRRDAFWLPGSVCEDYGAIRCPVLAVSGWADGYTNAVLRLLEHLEVPRLGLIGPWSHKYPHLGIPGPAIGFLQEALRFYDTWLKGLDTGIMNEPMLRVWMQDSVPPTTSYAMRPGRWVGEPSWPSPNVEEQRMPLGEHRLAANGASVARRRVTIQSPLTVGLFAGKWCSYAATPDLPHDQREEDGGALVIQSEPLPGPVEILGRPVAELEIAASQPVALVAVRLSDVRPDGKATRVSYGVLNLTHRDSHAAPAPLEVGRRYRVRLALNAIAHCFPAGNRLRVSISSSYWPLAWPPPRPAELTILTRESALWLPVRAPRPQDDDRLSFPGPEIAPPLAITPLGANRQNWYVHRDLATDESTLEVIRDDGGYRIHEIDLEIQQETLEWYSSRGDEFDSPRGETQTLRRFRRGRWDAEARTRTRLTSTPEHFELYAELDGYEGGLRVFSRTWKRRIRRDLV